MSEEESVALLKALGLNLYESRAYVALIKGKEMTAKGVGQSAIIPQSRTYDVLESLARKGFALATPASPTTYIPVPPAKILGSQYAAERKKIQETAAKVQEEAQAKLEGLRQAYAILTTRFPAKAVDPFDARDRVWVLQTRENIESALVELIREAKSTVFRITKPPELGSGEPLDPFYIVGMENRRYLSEALERKVQMKWLSLAREIPSFSGLELGELPERRYIEDEEDITEKFLLVDKSSVLLNLHDPASSAYGSVALAMQSRAAASIFNDHFEKVWSKGIPLDRILPKMREMVRHVCERLKEVGFSRAEVMFYQSLARLGAVSRETIASEMMKKKVGPEDTNAASDSLMRAGLVHRDVTYRLLVAEHPAKVRTAIDAGRVGHPKRQETTRKSSSGRNL